MRVAHIEADEVQLHSRKYVGSSARLEFDGLLWAVTGCVLHPVSRPRPTEAARDAWEALTIHVCSELQRSDKWAAIALQNEISGAKMVANYARRELVGIQEDLKKLEGTLDKCNAIANLHGQNLTAAEHALAASLINAGHSVADAFHAAKALMP